MNSATKNLENDHVHIIRLTDIMIAATRAGSPVVSHIESIVNIIKNFADGIHHEKEEQLLFPLMAERGFSLDQGPVAVMLHEHTLGRNFVKGIVEGTEKYKAGDQSAEKVIFNNMLGYADLLRNHISKENNILFRMADNALSETDHAHLTGEFAKVEESGRTGSNPAGYIGAIDFLAKIYLV